LLLLVSGCGVADAREAALKEASTKPLSSTNAWQPGLVALSDYTASGFGPAGYPNVVAQAIVDNGDTQLAAPQELLQSVSLKTSDLNGITIALMDKGDTLEQPTLDFCGASFASESKRVHRRQVAGSFNNNSSWISSEAVLYESPAAAQQAIDEMVAAKKACPEGHVFKSDLGTDITVNFFPAPGPNNTVLVPADKRVILNVIEKSSDTNLTPQRIFMAIQVRGSLLVAFYVVEGNAETFTQANLDALYGFVTAITDRMNALDPTEIGLN
jgi:hypothetical protein